jgi:L-2-hydroxyglutarate oxidase LhgO
LWGIRHRREYAAKKTYGVTDTRIPSRQDVQYLEPEAKCTGALLSPSTGVVDSHSRKKLSILADTGAHGATLALQTAVDDAQINTSIQKMCLHMEGTWIICNTVVNSAGLWAHQIASLIRKNHVWKPPKQFFAKGPIFDWKANPPLLLYWSNPVSQVLRAMAFKRTTRGRSNFGELMTAKIS